MSAADILDRLLIDLEDAVAPGHNPGDCPRAVDGQCDACDLSDMVYDSAEQARMERDRARLIFGEAA